MQRVFDYNDFMFDLLLESAVKNTLPFRLSKRLIILLKSIKNPISNDLLILDYTKEEKDVTYVDYDDKDINNFTYALSPKFYDFLGVKHHTEDKWSISKLTNMYYDKSPEIWHMYRTSGKIGRFVNKIFPKKYNEKEVELFVNAVKLKRTQQFERFKIVKGDDIVKFYNYHNYDSRANEGTPLGNSCMRYDECKEFIKFYPENNVEMVVLMSDTEEDKIIGRAILWNIKNINGEEVNRKYMDRIYTVNDYDVQNFKDFAISNSWLYKKNQNRYPNEAICDPIDNSCKNITLISDNTYKKRKYYPYLDTLSYFYWEEGYLSNMPDLSSKRDTDQPYFLQTPNGSYLLQGRRFVTYYGEFIDDEDLIYCEFGHDYRRNDDAVETESGDYATREYAEEHFRYSDMMRKWLDPENDDVIFLEYYDDHVTQNYAERYLVYSDYDDQFYREDDTVYSNYHETRICEDASIKVFCDSEDFSNTDWRVEGDGSYIEYSFRNERTKYYDKNQFADKFVRCLNPFGIMVWKHKEKDQDALIEYEGKWYYDMTLDIIKSKLRHEKS